MTQPRMFREADLTQALNACGTFVSRKLTAYLIGGCAMTFMGRKAATKDIDIVLGSYGDAKEFATALQQVGFVSVRHLTNPYVRLGAFDIVEDKQGMRFDIFDRQVCNALVLSDGMRARARPYRGFGNLEVKLVSPEDIFLFKGITERASDLDDMRILAEIGLEWTAIKIECLSQTRSGRWAYMLGTKLLELRQKHGITSPIIKTLMDHADTNLLLYVFRAVMGRQQLTFTEIAAAINSKYGYKNSWTRKQLTSLQTKGLVQKRKRARGFIYSMNSGSA